jgi:hypothetical protein
VEKVAMGYIFFFRVYVFPFITVIPSLLQAPLHLNTSLAGRTSGRNLGTFNPSDALFVAREHWTEKHLLIAFQASK